MSSEGREYRSAKWLVLFDCKWKTETAKQMALMALYAAAYGSGEVVSTLIIGIPEPSRVVPDTTGEILLKVVCNKSKSTTEEEISLIIQAKNNNPYFVYWESNDPAAWKEAVRQDELLRALPEWAGKSLDYRFNEVVRRVKAIMPEASEPPRRISF